MFLKKSSLERRTFLRGVGATLALPFLDAMTPAFASAAKRFQGLDSFTFRTALIWPSGHRSRLLRDLRFRLR